MAGYDDDWKLWVGCPDGFGQVDTIHVAGHSHICDHQVQPGGA